MPRDPGALELLLPKAAAGVDYGLLRTRLEPAATAEEIGGTVTAISGLHAVIELTHHVIPHRMYSWIVTTRTMVMRKIALVIAIIAMTPFMPAKMLTPFMTTEAASAYDSQRFCRGFRDGYIVGYKRARGTSLDPLVPLCPLQPLKKIGDPEDDYEHGYVIGYERGYEDGRQ